MKFNELLFIFYQGKKYCQATRTPKSCCRDIEVAKWTAYRWLARYFPKYYALMERGIVTNVTIPLPEGKYNTILADPPWQYEFSLSERGDPKQLYRDPGFFT